MTIAIDRISGKVLGQVIDRRQLEPNFCATCIQLLMKDGYVYVPATSVRVEEVS